MFMTRKGKVGVKCFLAKSIAPALDEEVLWICSTHRPSVFCPEPQENNLLYSASIVAQKCSFLNPFLAPRLFLNYCCQKEI